MSCEKEIKKQIDSNHILLYMKGTPEFPMCGFSSSVSNVLKELNIEYSYVNILERLDIRGCLPKISNWPTFPQLFVNGELVGGYDLIIELYKKNKLLNILKEKKNT